MKEFISINGRNIHISRSGSSTNEAIVFIHGNSLNKEVFNEQLNNIKDAPVISFDLPGHGESEKPSAPETGYTFNGYADVLSQLVEKLNLTDYVIAGHSLGGHIAINALSKLKGIKGLVVFGTPPMESINSLGEAFLPNPNFPYLLRDAITAEEARQVADAMLHHKEHTGLLASAILKTDPSARALFGASVGRGEVYNEVEMINKKNIPVALLHGKHDTFVNKRYLDKIQLNTLYEKKVRVLENSGHCPSAEDPKGFTDFICRFHKSVCN